MSEPASTITALVALILKGFLLILPASIGAVLATTIRRGLTKREATIMFAASAALGVTGGFMIEEIWQTGPWTTAFACMSIALTSFPYVLAIIRAGDRVRSRADDIGDAIADRAQGEIRDRARRAPRHPDDPGPGAQS